jgi:predicted peptidase
VDAPVRKGSGLRVSRPRRSRRWAAAIVATICVAASACTSHAAPAVASRRDVIVGNDTVDSPSVGYIVSLPAGYDASDAAYPALIFLHGFGEQGSGGRASLEKLYAAGLPRLIRSRALPDDAAGFVILMPQVGDDFTPAQLHSWLGDVLPRYRLDRGRLYLTGLSRGGGEALAYLNAYGSANEFAAIATISADFTDWSTPGRVPPCDQVANTPLWIFVGQDDDVVPHWFSRNAGLYINRACHPSEPDRITEFLNTRHNAWDLTYDLSGMQPGWANPDFDSYSISVYHWFLQHTRDPNRPVNP